MALLLHAADTPDPVMLEGDNAYYAGNYDAAIAKYTEVIEQNPKHARAYTDRALAYKEKKDFKRALADFNEALRLQPEGYVYYDRGVTYEEMGAVDKAIADYTSALKLKIPNAQLHAQCFIHRAHCYVDKEDADKALSDLNAAIKMGTKESDAFVLRGIVHKVRHEYELSLADYEKAIALDPNNPRCYNVEAYLLSVCPLPKYRDGRKAVSYATKACELSKWKDASYVETLAAAYAEMGQLDEAVKFQTKAAEIDPQAVDKKRLALYQQKQPFRDLNRKEQPIPNLLNIKDKVLIKFGQQLSARFQIRGGRLVDPKISPAGKGQSDSLSLDFRQDKRGRTLFLTHSFSRSMQARCLARLKGSDTYFETDILPVPVKTINPEIWSEPIEELVLFDFKLVDTKAR
jgi:tetratricopeptide (TPR) repeat protein